MVIECLNIWVSIISFDNTLLQDVFEEEKNKKGVSFSDILIDLGLFAESQELRKNFKNSLQFMCLNINVRELTQSPTIFFLRQLI